MEFVLPHTHPTSSLGYSAKGFSLIGRINLYRNILNVDEMTSELKGEKLQSIDRLVQNND